MSAFVVKASEFGTGFGSGPQRLNPDLNKKDRIRMFSELQL
jgi:hypothetical protein